MQEPHKKGLANRLDPESCAGDRKVAGEALTGAHTGQPLSSEIILIGVPTLCCEGEGHMQDGDIREPSGKRRGVTDPEHVWKLLAREPGDLGDSLVRGDAGRPEKAVGPHVRHARLRGVGRSRSTDEAGEQSWPLGDGGVRRGKEIDQGKRLSVGHAPDTAPGHAGRYGGQAYGP